MSQSSRLGYVSFVLFWIKLKDTAKWGDYWWKKVKLALYRKIRVKYFPPRRLY